MCIEFHMMESSLDVPVHAEYIGELQDMGLQLRSNDEERFVNRYMKCLLANPEQRYNPEGSQSSSILCVGNVTRRKTQDIIENYYAYLFLILDE